MKVHVGCSGFPVARTRYFERFRIVEIASTYSQLPRLSTLERWKRDIPQDTILSVCAWQTITHPCTHSNYGQLRPKPEKRRMLHYGHFRDTFEVRESWKLFEETLRVLEPAFIFFRTPATFYPNADHLRDMYRFFKTLRRGKSVCVWQPLGGSWDARMIRKVCMDLGLVHGVDPLKEESVCGATHYYRLSGRTRYDRDCRYTDEEMNKVLARCTGKSSYVFFDTHGMWRDAQHFEDLSDPIGARLRQAARNRPFARGR